VDLEIAAGEFVSLLGPSGSGKSTILMVLAGFVTPDTGEVRLGAQSLLDVPPHRRDIGVVFQRHALFPHMTVAENIGFPLKLRGVERSEMVRRIEEALALVRLEGYGSRRVNQLSGGQSQRVALARAVVFSPRMLLMDEPLSALDKSLREQMQIEIRALHDALGLTTIYVTHDQREALTLSDRIAVVNKGQIVQVGTPQEVYERPVDSFVADFIGETCLVPVEESPAGLAALGQWIGPQRETEKSRRFLVLRPGKLEICPGRSESEGCVHFEGKVARPVYEGETTLYQVVLAPGVVARCRSPIRQTTPLAEGEVVTLRLHENDILIVPEGAR